MPKHAKTEHNEVAPPDTFTEELDQEQEDRDAFDASEDPEAGDSSVQESAESTPIEVVPQEPLVESGVRGGEQKPAKKHLTVQQKKSRRMRKVLIGAIILVFIFFGLGVYGVYQIWNTVQQEAVQKVSEISTGEVDELKQGGDTGDAASVVSKKVQAPDLVGLIGKTQDEAIAAIGLGATVMSSTEIGEEDNPIKTNVKVALTDEPGDTRSGTPSVYLGLSEEGKILSAGYSAATKSLGYKETSFFEAVVEEYIVEKTFAEAGLALPEGSAVLPEDESLYRKYGSDKTTLTEESYTFTGEFEQDGVTYTWSSVLRYDYAAANASGNIADTIRQIYIYVNA